MAERGFEGTEQLISALRELPENLQKRVLQAWASRWARKTANAAKAAAPKGRTGNLKRGVAARNSSKRVLNKLGSLARSVVIGKKPAYHFHWVNQGSGGRVRVGGAKSKRYLGRKFGRMPANPFLQKAANPILSEAQSDVKGGLAREVQRMLDRATKRTLSSVR